MVRSLYLNSLNEQIKHWSREKKIGLTSFDGYRKIFFPRKSDLTKHHKIKLYALEKKSAGRKLWLSSLMRYHKVGHNKKLESTEMMTPVSGFCWSLRWIFTLMHYFSHLRKDSSWTHKISRCKEFHFSDSLNFIQDEIEFTPDQIELSIRQLRNHGKTWNSSLGGWNL